MRLIKELKSVGVSSLAMAWGIFTGYELWAGNRLYIPTGTPKEVVFAAVFVGGLIGSIIVCLIIKFGYETVKTIITESHSFIRQRRGTK